VQILEKKEMFILDCSLKCKKDTLIDRLVEYKPYVKKLFKFVSILINAQDTYVHVMINAFCKCVCLAVDQQDRGEKKIISK